MKIPFTIEQFFEVFGKYNTSVWPMQIVFYLLAMLTVIFLIINKPFAKKITYGVLSFFWAWMGIMYHFVFFSVINPAAKIFGTVFIIQSSLFLIGIFKKEGIQKNLSFRKWQPITGFIFIFYSLILYPLLVHVSGHNFPYMPTLGLPCPTTIFTIGIFLITFKAIPKYLVVVPILWTIIGGTAAFKLGVRADLGLIVAGLFLIPLLFNKKEPVKVADLNVAK